MPVFQVVVRGRLNRRSERDRGRVEVKVRVSFRVRGSFKVRRVSGRRVCRSRGGW